MNSKHDKSYLNNKRNIYIVKNQYGFTPTEKAILTNIRTKLVEFAINNEESNFIGIDEIRNAIISTVSNNNIDENYIDDLSKRFYEEINGYGVLNQLINDDKLEEIMINGPNRPVYVYHREKGMLETDFSLNDDDEIIRIIDSIARENNRRFDNESPILDGRLKDGSRINATLNPISADGPTLTIRKFKKDPFTIIDLIKNNTIDLNMAAFLWLCIDGLGVFSANIIISGGTSSGKTTMLNALSALINPNERIISIEDTLELQIPHKHVLRMETRLANVEGKGELNMDILVKNSLRQRPDRIIVGEVRGKEAITLFTALNTGHSGFGTLHSNSARETITRLTNSPMNVPKIMISALNFILMEKRFYSHDGKSYRRVTELCEVVGMEEGVIQLNKIFEWNPSNDTFDDVSFSSNTIEKLMEIKGIPRKLIDYEISKRKLILEIMLKNNFRSNKTINNIMEFYYNENYNELLETLKNHPNYFIN